MIPIEIAMPFYLAVSAYLAAAALSLAYARGADSVVLKIANRSTIAGAVLLLVVLFVRWGKWGAVPLTGLADSLIAFLFFSTVVVLAIQRDESMKPLLAFYYPALGAIALVGAVAGPSSLAQPPRALNGLLLTVHIAMVFLAFALFFAAGMTSIVYALKARSLKRRQSAGFLHRAPSLERLDATLYRLIAIGYPVFVVMMVLAFLWAWAARDLLGPYWFVSSKVVFAWVMALMYATSFHVRRFGWLRGPKLAYLVFYAFAFLLVTYLAFGLLHAADYSFWKRAT